MRNVVRYLGLVALLLGSINVNAEIANYIGIDYNIRSMDGRDHDNYAMRLVLPDLYHGYEIYAAHRFNSDVGLSLGWEQTQYATQNHTFVNGENFLGDKQSAGDRTSIQARVEGIHLDVIGYYNFSDNFEAIGQLGLALMRVTMHAYAFAGGVTTNMAPSNNFDNLVPRISFGLQYFTRYKVGLRMMGSWQGTNMYNMSLTDEDGVRSKIKPFQQSWIFSIGIVGKF